MDYFFSQEPSIDRHSEQVAARLMQLESLLDAGFLKPSRRQLKSWQNALHSKPKYVSEEILRSLDDKSSPLHVKFHNGPDYIVNNKRLWEKSGRLIMVRNNLYQSALELWIAAGGADDRWQALLREHGSAAEVFKGKLHVISETPTEVIFEWDLGDHAATVRQDQISYRQAAQASLGAENASRMLSRMMDDLSRRGIDPYRRNVPVRH